MAAYHSMAVTLGQSGLIKELLNLIESMRQKPSKMIKNLRRKSWDPVLEPDLVVYNAVRKHLYLILYLPPLSKLDTVSLFILSPLLN